MLVGHTHNVMLSWKGVHSSSLLSHYTWTSQLAICFLVRQYVVLSSLCCISLSSIFVACAHFTGVLNFSLFFLSFSKCGVFATYFVHVLPNDSSLHSPHSLFFMYVVHGHPRVWYVVPKSTLTSIHLYRQTFLPSILYHVEFVAFFTSLMLIAFYQLCVFFLF